MSQLASALTDRAIVWKGPIKHLITSHLKLISPCKNHFVVDAPFIKHPTIWRAFAAQTSLPRSQPLAPARPSTLALPIYTVKLMKVDAFQFAATLGLAPAG
jgi:hypothetical protein